MISRRSATAACLAASGWSRSCAIPLTASTVVTSPSTRKFASIIGSVMSVERIGAGSASPVVSIATRS